MEPYLGPLESIGDAPALRHGAYAIDDVVVAQSCLSPELVGVLVQDGFDSLREGTYLSMWRSNPDVLSRLDVTTEIPDGANASVTVETGDADGKVLHSETMNLTSGHLTYPLGRMMTLGAQVRIRTRLVVAGDGVSRWCARLSCQAWLNRLNGPRLLIGGKELRGRASQSTTLIDSAQSCTTARLMQHSLKKCVVSEVLLVVAPVFLRWNTKLFRKISFICVWLENPHLSVLQTVALCRV
jgi:hypothetical protein